MAESAQGRRVLVAVVTGEVGKQIQAWRERHDPKQARRLPPHATLCYWLPDVEMDVLDKQVRHAFPGPVRLGSVREFDNVDRTFFVDVSETEVLDSAREVVRRDVCRPSGEGSALDLAHHLRPELCLSGSRCAAYPCRRTGAEHRMGDRHHRLS